MAFVTDGKHFGQYTYEHWFDHEYGNNDNKIIDEIGFNTIVNRPFVMIDGIAYFVPEKEPDGNIEWADGLVSGNWVEKIGMNI
jgi:hypothetical protein